MNGITYPVELRDDELGLVAAGTGSSSPPPSHHSCGCGGHDGGSLINVETGDINVLNNIAVLSVAKQFVL